MTQTSEPIINVNLSHAAWGRILDNGDGVTGDTTGGAYKLTAGAGDTVSVAVGQYRIDGYLHRVTAAHDIALATGNATYTVALVYDPARQAHADGPIYLDVSSGTISTPSGGKVVPLWTVPRTTTTTLAQAIAAATDLRVWAGEAVYAKTKASLPASPLGSVGHTEGGLVYLRRLSGTAVVWAARDSGTVTPMSGWAALSATNYPLRLTRTPSGTVTAEGLVVRSGASLSLTPGSDVQIGVLPAGYAPEHNHFVVVPTRSGIHELIVFRTGEVSLRAKSALTVAGGGPANAAAEWVSIATTWVCAA